jgi:Coenzyme PQQ synthesis protein D (PqqD)
MPLPDYPERLAGLYSEELEGLDEVIYVRPEDGASFSLNLTAASVLELCDGRHSRDEIARQLADALPAGSAPEVTEIGADVDAILNSFAEHGLIYAAPDPTG